MAETAVSNVIQQLATLLIAEVNKVRGARDGVVSIHQDLEFISAFLKDADQQQHSKQAVKVWVKQVRELAYSIEDVLDTFSYRMGRPSGRGLAGFYRTSTRFIRRQYALRWVSGEVDRLGSQLRAISARRNDFGLAEASNRVAADGMGLVPRLASMFVEESQIVGIEKPKGEIIHRLLDSKKWKYAVVSLDGMGGLGKTTLARKVYEDPVMKQNFSCLAWITVSTTFVPEDLLSSMYKQLHNVPSTTTKPSSDQLQPAITKAAPSSDNVSTMTYIQVVEALRAFLRDKCYLVVLDDIWTVDAWEVIKCGLPENDKGSRIMVTTRSADVAIACSKNEKLVHHLQPLSESEAKELFCKKVFGADTVCPPELDNKATKFLGLCGGLPLAVVAIGGLLSTKRMSPNEWESVLQSIGSELETNDRLKAMRKILWLSYDDLPHHLKPCFLYFGVFPEDYPVKRSEVSRLWIAEGFVKPLPNKSLEKISEDYLQELVQRSLVQASSTFSLFSRMENIRFGVHDLMYELILSKSKEQNFHLSSPTISGPSATTEAELPDNVRRLVPNVGPSLPALSSFIRLRSLLLLGVSSVAPLLSTYRSLKVLHIESVEFNSFPAAILELFHLRYLHMRRANIRSLPKDISRLRNLLTLDLKWNPISSLPQGILKLKKLRHIMTNGSSDDGVELPEKLGSLTCLQNLTNVKITGGAAQFEELSKLNQLTKLAIVKFSPDDGVALCSAIKNMIYLQSLSLLCPGEDDQLLPVDQLYVNSPFLTSIHLWGRLNALPESILSPNCLEKLLLVGSKLQTDIFMSLQHLPCLMELRLENKAYEGEWLRTERGGFKKLRKMDINRHSRLRQVVIAEGAMPNLVYLRLFECGSLESVPAGIEHLKNLKEFNLWEVPVECLKKMKKDEGEDWDRVKHIPLIQEIYVDETGILRRDPRDP